MFSQIITLLKEKEIIDEAGDVVRTYEKRELFAREDRIYFSESIQAMVQGFEKQRRFTISDYLDYDNEEELLFDGKKYRIVNTQVKGVALEINCVLRLDNE